MSSELNPFASLEKKDDAEKELETITKDDVSEIDASKLTGEDTINLNKLDHPLVETNLPEPEVIVVPRPEPPGKPVELTEAQRILAKHGGLPSNIPINSKYWQLRHAKRKK